MRLIMTRFGHMPISSCQEIVFLQRTLNVFKEAFSQFKGIRLFKIESLFAMVFRPTRVLFVFEFKKTVCLCQAGLKRSFYVSFCSPSAHSSAQKKLLLTLPLSALRPGVNPIQMFTLQVKTNILGWGQFYKVVSKLYRCMDNI